MESSKQPDGLSGDVRGGTIVPDCLQCQLPIGEIKRMQHIQKGCGTYASFSRDAALPFHRIHAPVSVRLHAGPEPLEIE
jgi:hypothetical protein